MNRIFANWGLIAGIWLILLVAACLVVLITHGWRQKRGHHAPWRDSVAEAAIVVGTVPWLILIVWPGDGGRAVELTLLRDLAAQVAEDPVTASIQIAANLVLFVPLGVFGPIRWPALRSVWRLALVGFGGSALLETLQYVLELGRVSSVDDVLLNGGGMVLAAVASRRWWRPRSHSNEIQQVRTPSGVA